MYAIIWLPEAEIAPTAASRAPIDRPVAVVDGVNATPATYSVHTDHLHRPVRMSDAGKVIVWSAEYQPWGAVQSLSGALTLDLRFPYNHANCLKTVSYEGNLIFFALPIHAPH